MPLKEMTSIKKMPIQDDRRGASPIALWHRKGKAWCDK